MGDLNMDKSEIKEFYQDTKVFITGATGFLGKTLMEKLLRVTEVDTIYILIREKKGKTVQERLNKIFQNALFDVLRTTNPNFQSKIKPVVGDCGIPGLGLSEADRTELIANVNVMFHAAATVNFDENLKTAYDINFNGTRTIINMVKEMKGLKSMVFVSTAYSNCIRNTVIKEEVYEYPFDDVSGKLDKMSKETAETVKKEMIGEWPNTYTFTKSLTEILVKRERSELPIGIFRPSIVTSTYQEPIPGWIDNIYAINGIAVGIMTGFLRVFPGKADTYMDLIPVDMCISAMLVSAKEIFDTAKTESDIRVYNFTCGTENPITYDLFRFLNQYFGVPASKSIWYPCGVFAPDGIRSSILSFLLQIIPGFLMDLFAILTGNKPQLLSLYSKVLNFGDKVKFFGKRDWEFDNSNVRVMWKRLNKSDQELFPFSMAAMSWLLFARSYTLGLRRYVLKEDDSTLDQAFTKLNRLCILHWALKSVVIFLVCRAVSLVYSLLYNMFQLT